MTAGLRLVIFDVDGTLVDSQADIMASMAAGFAGEGLPCPPREAVLGIVGLSLVEALERLAPDLESARRARIVEGYKQAYNQNRLDHGASSSPFYPGARDMLDTLAARDDLLLGVATGKSLRGLTALLDTHGLNGVFVTRQTADHHPSKPHPAMLLAALAETGIDSRDAVMVGDTSFDMDMAQAAKIAAVGVTWGYHPASALTAAQCLISEFGQLPQALDRIWETTA